MALKCRHFDIPLFQLVPGRCILCDLGSYLFHIGVKSIQLCPELSRVCFFLVRGCLQPVSLYACIFHALGNRLFVAINCGHPPFYLDYAPLKLAKHRLCAL